LAINTCWTISAAVRLRTRACVPVWQKVQLSVQPTWLETHSAPERPTPGMNTVSHSTPGDSSIRYLRVPSTLTLRSVMCGRASVKCPGRRSRSSRERSVIISKSVMP